MTGTTPTPTTTTSASIAVPSSSRTRSTRSWPSNPATPTPRRRSTPWSRCSSPHTLPSSDAEPAHERRGERLEHGDVEAASATGCRDLRPDEARADHDHLRATGELGADRERVGQRAEHEDPGEIGSAGQRARRRTGGDDQPVECERFTRVEGERAVREVDGLGARPRTAGRDRGRRTGACAARAARARTPRRGSPSTAVDGRTGAPAPRRRARAGRRSPSRRSVSTARRPASDAPTTAIVCSSMRKA